MAGPSQFRLMRERRFAALFWTQFLGAANDNLFKFAFTLLATYHAAQWGGLDAKSVGFVIGAIFILPFFFFSATSGQVADKFDKGSVMRFVKTLEIAIMAIAAYGFTTHHAAAMYTCVFLMGLHSTLFGPVKYAYLPQHLSTSELTGGNGLVEMGTFVAILLGTMAGGILVSDVGGNVIAWVCVGVAIAGWIASQFVPPSPALEPGLRINWNPLSETWKNLGVAAKHRSVFNSLIGISWLWFFGSVFLTSFTPFSRDVLHGDEDVVTLLLAIFSFGIGTGSLLCDKMSGRKIEIGLVPFGAIGMTLFAIDIWWSSSHVHAEGMRTVHQFLADSSSWPVMADLFLVALFGGFFSVPLYALIQVLAEPTHRARIIAANNIMNAFFIVVAALMSKALLDAGLTFPQLFLVVGLMNAAVAAYIFLLVPEFLVRFLCWLLVHTFYRLDKSGLENIPEKGAAMLVCNHVSFVDPLVILAASPRPIRFVMDHNIFKLPVISFVFRTGKAIPIAPAKVDAKLLADAYDKVSEALRNGELVAIFPEGRITDNGELYPFRSGIEQIVERDPVPVIPLALQGLWGSMYSRKGGPAFSKPLRRGMFNKIALVAGTPVPPEQATREHLQAIVASLRGDRK